ncbi:MAG TPA: hypothetical protein VGJ18_18810 [Gemmatimonadaceae bacterium]|jgi:hypothetical protein
MRQHMTVLQRAVVQRLREEGYNAQADAANDAWSHGEQVLGLPNMVHPRDAELRADYDRADAQARA